MVITSNEQNGFSLDTPIKLQLELTADKLLTINAKVGSETCLVSAINPFANKELTSQERIALRAEKKNIIQQLIIEEYHQKNVCWNWQNTKTQL